MTGRFEGRTLIVVGAGTGIGAATAKRLSSEGGHVCVADINRDAAEAVAADIQRAGGKAFAETIDIADEASVIEAFERVDRQFVSLHGAHLNAADLRTIFADSDAVEEDLVVFDRTISVNLRGHLLCVRQVVPRLRASGGGAIVFTSSGAAHQGEPERPAYAASKSGLNALMRHVAARWGREGITANCVAPGFVMTPEMIAGGQVPESLIEAFLRKTPCARVGNVEDISGVVAMLLSADGSYVNGQVINVNGGSLMF